jgi:antitoxin ParD1/3/4
MPTMNVSLSSDLAEFVEGEVSGGDYVSASEVVRDALRALKRDRQVEQEKLRILREEVGRGIDAADRGEFSDRSIQDILKEVLRGQHG